MEEKDTPVARVMHDGRLQGTSGSMTPLRPQLRYPTCW
jgi:hypothetical protein